MMEEDTKDVEGAIEQSIQPRATGEAKSGFMGFLNYLTSGSYRIAPWWSPQRDEDLTNFWKDSDHLGGALTSLIDRVSTVPVRVLPRNTSIRLHQKQAEDFTIKLNEQSEFGAGWVVFMQKWLEDYWASDNGGFFEVIGPGKADGPIEGAATGVAHLDSLRCTRTGSPEFPVVYRRPDGGVHKLHYTRVGFASGNPSAREEMYGIGVCALSRCVNAAQNLIDIATYKQEKLGSRPLRGILTARGISTDQVLNALAIAAEDMDNRGMSIFSRLPVLGDIPTDAALELIDLVSLPDGYDEETSSRLGMYIIAMAFGVPIRWLWPAQTSGATKADAMYQHIAGLGGGVGLVLRTMTLILGGDPRGSRHDVGKFLPPHLKLEFDFQDDEQDRMRAEIGKKRADARNANLEVGVYDVRTAREHALQNDDITQSQFERMELEDGRLPSGDSVLTLFHSTNEPYFSWLDLGFDNPLAVGNNDAMRMLAEINAAAINIQNIMANNSNAARQRAARESLAALGRLKSMYAPLAQQQIQNQVFSRLGIQPGTAPQTEEMENATEEEVKSFDFSVSAGEIIGGQLARGAGGQFVNAQNLLDQIQSGMLARMRGGGENDASLLRLKNRLALAEKLGIPVEQLDGLSAMRVGEASPEIEQALVSAGLAQVNADGSVTMTKDARSLLKAANSGDVDQAKESLAEARKPKGGGGGGGKPKKTDEEKRREREEREARIRQENFSKVADEIDLPIKDFQALQGFYVQGADLTPEDRLSLARQGLVEIDDSGSGRLTREGRAFMRAAERGNVRDAKDALSLADERVADTLEKADQYRERASDYEQRAEQKARETRGRIQELQDRVAETEARANTYETEAAAIENEASDVQNILNDVQSALANTQDPAQRAELQRQSRILQEQLNTLQEQVTRKREQAQALYDRIQQTENTIVDIATSAVEMIEKWREQAESYRNQASDLENSVGGGAGEKQKPGLFKRILAPLIRRKQKVEPRGDPVPFTAQDVLVNDEDIERSIKGWSANESLPEQARSILEARQATPQEIAQARVDEELF